jgi:hypothetical protein
MERAVDKEVASLPEAERKFALNFLAPAENPQNRERSREMEPIGPSIGQVFDQGLAELQSAALGMDIQPPQVDAPSVSGPEIEAPSSAGPAIEAPEVSGPAIEPMQIPDMEIE